MAADPMPRHYDTVAKTFHWLTAVLVLGQIAFGWWLHLVIADQPVTDAKIATYAWHKSFGLVVLVVTLARFAWRVGHPPPPLPATMPGWQRAVAAASHAALYVLLIAMPIAGIAQSNGVGIPVKLFNLIELPPLFSPDRRLADTALAAHWWMAVSLALVLALHVGAAVKHHLVDRDDVLRRMLPGAGRST